MVITAVYHANRASTMPMLIMITIRQEREWLDHIEGDTRWCTNLKRGCHVGKSNEIDRKQESIIPGQNDVRHAIHLPHGGSQDLPNKIADVQKHRRERRVGVVAVGMVRVGVVRVLAYGGGKGQ